MSKTIALVDDDDVIRKNYSKLLSKEGYQVRVYSEKADAYRNITFDPPDLALIDIGLGRERNGGFKLCREIRFCNKALPIIFLSCNSSNDAHIEGFKCDVDGYIIKGDSSDLFLVRIASLFRRLSCFPCGLEKSCNIMERRGLVLDFYTNTVRWKAQRVKLTFSQYCIVRELAIQPGETKSFSTLMHAANRVVEPNTIVSNIKIIRNRFKAIDPTFDCIKAKYSVGYRWIDSNESSDASENISV